MRRTCRSTGTTSISGATPRTGSKRQRSANVTECYERQHSIVPQQALALMNSDVALKHARILARTIAAKSGDAEAFATSAFEHVLARAPTPAERTECATFLAAQTKAYQ